MQRHNASHQLLYQHHGPKPPLPLPTLLSSCLPQGLHKVVLEELLLAGADINGMTSSSGTPLMAALHQGKLAVAKLLLGRWRKHVCHSAHAK
jgi:ankyrin repeat protein